MIKGRELLRPVFRNSPFAKMAQMRNERPIISFTFDDFPRSAALIGAKILEKYDARGTFYTTGSFCGQVVDGVVQYRAEDLSALFSAGHEIGCHTFYHRRVSSLTRSMLIEDTTLNGAFIARHLPNVVMRTFAYPFGDVSFKGTFTLERIFDGCRSIESGLNKGVADLGRLRAIRLYNCAINPEDICCLIHKAASPNSWLIFYTHDVSEEPSKFGCTPGLFEYAVMTAASVGVEILPVSDAIRVVRDR
jgi:peptidoglycan/xylan/chitin deacetylase (PgdA/CDA1 family)